MKEIYDWVPWFTELSRKIAAGDPKELVDRARQVTWSDKEKDPPTMIRSVGPDPFTFIYYIIGAMNTADRSIQLLDTALRRRFEFVEMMPNADHERISEDIEGVNCRKMLRAMNECIAALLDREHQIGHTYLFDVNGMEDLARAFQNKIFPLLQEYFFDDWTKIRPVLGGNGFVQEQNPPKSLQDSDLLDPESRNYDRLPKDDSRWRDSNEYRKIYESPKPDTAE